MAPTAERPRSDDAGTHDVFGNLIDPVLGYARGRILGDDASFRARIRHARELMRARAASGGRFHVLTGNRADFPIRPDDPPLADGWVGPALFGPDLAARARAHVGADDRHDVEVFNRTAAGVVAAISALAVPGGVVVSLVPAGRAHPCVRRGAHFAGATVVEGPSLEAVGPELDGASPALVVITPVTSELECYEHDDLLRVARSCRAAGIPTLVDDAYGARVRPVLLGGPATFELPIDLGITNGDKAALGGPRSGLMVGDPDLLGRVATRGVELGQEAREPVQLGLLRALERYSPEHLRADASGGQALAAALTARLGAEHIRPTLLGPTISEESMLRLLLERADVPAERCGIVPAEAVTAVCMLLLAEHGIVTVNATSEAGSRPSLRLKPTADAVDALGGADALAGIVVAAIDRVATFVHGTDAVAALIVGDVAPRPPVNRGRLLPP